MPSPTAPVRRRAPAARSPRTARALGLGLGLALGAPALAGPQGVIGVDFLPLGRADLAWTDEGRLSGVLANEEDGFLQGPLRMWGGAAWTRHAVTGSLSAVRLKTTTWTASEADGDDLVTETVQGGLRPALDWRYYFLPRQAGLASPYLGAGFSAVIPTVKYSSETWTASEESAWLAQQAEDRARVRGAGGRIFGGAELLWSNGLLLGVRQSFELQRGERVDTEAARTTALLSTETALSLGFVF
jgi:hypothetical protein